MMPDGCVLVTGGTGFLGRHLARALVAMGREVVVTYRPSPADASLEEAYRAGTGALPFGEWPNNPPPGVRQEALELTDRQAVRRLLDAVRPSILFHLAADTRVERALGLLTPQLEVNTLAGAAVLEAALDKGVKRVVWVGTCEEYGDGPVPFREDQAPQPVSPYSISKVAGSLMAWSLARTMGAPIVVVRPFLTYGPEQPSSRFIPQAIHAALAGRPFPMTPGEQTRDLLYVTDTVAGLLAAAATPEAVGEIVNLASGLEHRMIDVALRIFALAGADPVLVRAGALPYRPGEAMRFFGDPAKAERLLHWRAAVSLEAGLGQTFAWYRALWDRTHRE